MLNLHWITMCLRKNPQKMQSIVNLILGIGLDLVRFSQSMYSRSVLWHFGFHFLVVILQVYFGIKLKSFSNMGLNLTAQTKTDKNTN
jgi:hypothetical protein